MTVVRILLIGLLFAGPAMAQTTRAPSELGHAAPRPGAPARPAATAVKPAPRTPVVHAPLPSHAQKPPPAKHAPKPPAKPPVRPTAKPAAKPPAHPPLPARPAARPPVKAAPAVVPPPVAVPPGAPTAPATPSPEPAPDPNKGAVTGQPIPRFMSLRFDDVNLRVGPGTRYPIDWVYHRRDLPVEVIRELDDWRLVQDQDNIRGWVRAQTLSPRRGFVVRGAERALRSKPADDASPVALLKPGVVGLLHACAAGKAWCEAEVGQYHGWLKRDDIYGVYTAETIGG